MGFDNKKVVVIGFGKSGRSAAQWLSKKGASVTISERKSLDDLPREQVLAMRELGVEFENGEHRLETFVKADLIVTSPGVPLDIDPLEAARVKGIPIKGEMQLAVDYLDIPIIAVTGTNGKSTVTCLIGDMIFGAGHKAFVGGNIGTPLTDYLLGRDSADYAVLEVSSFQLDIMESFSPDIAILLNISPDHLDRYKSYDDYIRSKLKMVAHQRKNQFAILNNDDNLLRKTEPSGDGKVLRYGLESANDLEAFVDGEMLFTQIPGQEPQSFNLNNSSLPGIHNRENLMAGVLAGIILDLDQDSIQRTIDEFKGLPHRLEWLRKINNIDFYNDSKATNIDAALRAVKSFDRPIVLIAGGRHKGADYLPLTEGARGRVKHAVLLGEARELLEQAFRSVCPCTLVEDMTQAVELASSLAQPGDVVLLSPACSSFDMFQDYVQRGEVFRTIVKGLSNGQ